MTKKNSKISTNALCVILLGIFLSMRPIMENSLQARVVGNDCVITSFIACVINLLFTFLVCFCIEKNQGMSFKQILEKLLGTFVTKIVLLILAFIFFFKLLLADYQMSELLYDSIYSDINWTMFVIPIFAIFAYLSIKGMKTISRCYQILVPFGFLLLVATMIIGVKNANFENLLPLFDHTPSEFSKALLYLLLQSSEFIFLFTFMENVVSKSHGYYRTILWVCLLILILIVGFYILFISILGNIAPFVQESLIKMTQFGSTSYSYFKIDIFTATMGIPMIILECSLLTYGISYCFKQIFNYEKDYTSIIVVSIIFISKFFAQINSQSVTKFYYDKIGIIVLGFIFMLPILLVIASFKEKKNDKKYLAT